MEWRILNEKKQIERSQELLRIVAENPDLPVVAMVDSDIVCEDCGRWLGSFGIAYVGEYAIYNEKYYDEREDFIEDYFCQNDDECKDMIKEYQKEKSIQMQELYLNEIELLQSRQRNNYLIMRKLMLNQNIKSEIFLEIESTTDVKMMCQIIYFSII